MVPPSTKISELVKKINFLKFDLLNYWNAVYLLQSFVSYRSKKVLVTNQYCNGSTTDLRVSENIPISIHPYISTKDVMAIKIDLPTVRSARGDAINLNDLDLTTRAKIMKSK
jgi:hypothetical protein